MKKIFSILVAAFAFAMVHDFDRACASAAGIPLSAYAGKFAITSQGSQTYCFTSYFSALESCSTTGAVTADGNVVAVGEEAIDASGNACATLTGTVSFGLSKLPPTVTTFHSVVKVTNYHVNTSTGDTSFTDYSGGSCVGATFNSSGATITATGTQHFAGSAGGSHIDALNTTLVDTLGSVSAFNVVLSALKQ